MSRKSSVGGVRPRTLRALVESLERRALLSTNVLSAHYDNSNTGQDLTETTLTPQNVNASTFGQLYKTKLSGAIFAQPLYDNNVDITTGTSQGVHNVVFIATEMDSVYAIDADTGAILWQDSFIDPANGITPVGVGDIAALGVRPDQGITGTPVIDPANNTMYCDVETRNVIGTQVHLRQTLYALNIENGAEANGSPAVIGDSVSVDAAESAFLPSTGPVIPAPGREASTGSCSSMPPMSCSAPG